MNARNSGHRVPNEDDDFDREFKKERTNSITSPGGKVKVELRPHQIENFNNLVKILQNFFFAFDLSLMGTGKTRISCKIAQYFNFKHMIVICPNTVINTWQKVSDLYSLPIPEEHGIINYEAFAGRSQGLNKSGLLKREDEKYKATKKLINYIEEGTLFVIDEIQRAKNTETTTYKAIKSLVNKVGELVNSKGSSSRVIFATGTLIDKDFDQLLGLLRIIMIVKSKDLKKAYSEVFEYAKNLDPVKTKEISKIETDDLKEKIIDLYTGVIQKFITSAMPQEKIEYNLDAKNGFYYLSEKSLERLNKTVNELSKTLKKPEEKKKRSELSRLLEDIPQKKVDTIFTLSRKIENATLEIHIRKTIETLENNPNAKVCLVFSYTIDIMTSYYILKKYKPLLFYGDISREERILNVDKFNRPDNKYRLLISNLSVVSTGIDLHDTDGRFPRYAFISPNYRAMDTQQVIYRFYRVGIKSDAHIRFIYSLESTQQKSIQDSYSKKSESFKKFMEFQAKSGVLFPGEYEEENEQKLKDDPFFGFRFNGEKVTMDNIADIIDQVGTEIESEFEEEKNKMFQSEKMVSSPNSPKRIIEINKSKKLDNEDEIKANDIFDFDEDSKEYRKFSKYFDGLELVLRFAIYMSNPTKIKGMKKDDLETLTKTFDYQNIAVSFLKHYSDLDPDEIDAVVTKYESNKSRFFNKFYKKYVDNSSKVKLWFS